MAGNNSLQMLRGAASAIAASTATLLAGQPVYDMTNNLLYVGDGSTTQIKSKAPIAAGSIKKANGTEVLGVNSDRARLAFGASALEMWDGAFYLGGTQGSNEEYRSVIYFDNQQLKLEHSSDGYSTTDSQLKLDGGVVTISAAGDVDQGGQAGPGATLTLSNDQKEYSNGKGLLEVRISDTSTVCDTLSWGQSILDMKIGSFGSLNWHEDYYKLELGDSANNGKITSTFMYDGEEQYSFITSLALESSARNEMIFTSETQVGLKTRYVDYSAGEDSPYYTGNYASMDVFTNNVTISAHSTSGTSSGHSTMEIMPNSITIQTSSMNYLKLDQNYFYLLTTSPGAQTPSNDIKMGSSYISLGRAMGRGLSLFDDVAYFGGTYTCSTTNDSSFTNITKIDLDGVKTVGSTANTFSRLSPDKIMFNTSSTLFTIANNGVFTIGNYDYSIPSKGSTTAVNNLGGAHVTNYGIATLSTLSSSAYYGVYVSTASSKSYGVNYFGTSDTPSVTQFNSMLSANKYGSVIYYGTGGFNCRGRIYHQGPIGTYYFAVSSNQSFTGTGSTVATQLTVYNGQTIDYDFVCVGTQEFVFIHTGY